MVSAARRHTTAPTLHRKRDEEQLPDLRHERHRQQGNSRRAGWSQTLATPDSGRHERPQSLPRRKPDKMRQNLRRNNGKLPSARRPGHLSDPRAHVARMGRAESPHRQTRKLRLHCRNAPRRNAVHRSPARPSRPLGYITLDIPFFLCIMGTS